MAIWGLTLIWPLLNTILTPRAAEALLVGLVVAVSAYFLGRSFTYPPTELQAEIEPDRPAKAQPTRPSLRMRRTPRPTRPIPELLGREFHSRATQPIPVVSGPGQHSRITRPMPIAR